MRKIDYSVGLDNINPSTVQFAGFAGIALNVGLYCLLAGNLLNSLN